MAARDMVSAVIKTTEYDENSDTKNLSPDNAPHFKFLIAENLSGENSN